jgi:hypothetical protein
VGVIRDAKVAAAFAAFPPRPRARLKALREVICDTAAGLDLALEESLKWGEPAYRAKGGSTVRLGWKAASPDEVAMYFICTTNLVAHFRELYPKTFRFGGERALLFDLTSRLPSKALRHCVGLALTYHGRGSAKR